VHKEQLVMAPKIRALDHLVLTVASISETVQFYTQVLGAEAQPLQLSDGSTRWALQIGQQKINLHPQGREFEPKAAYPLAGSGDLCFLTDTALSHWIAHLDAQGVMIEDGPVPRNGATGPIMSLYLRDPDGNLIEISMPNSIKG
jgi:catechol 2,3-dioxygenase-like lactoylglutathione lyase family enzyme